MQIATDKFCCDSSKQKKKKESNHNIEWKSESGYNIKCSKKQHYIAFTANMEGMDRDLEKFNLSRPNQEETVSEQLLLQLIRSSCSPNSQVQTRQPIENLNKHLEEELPILKLFKNCREEHSQSHSRPLITWQPKQENTQKKRKLRIITDLNLDEKFSTKV